ncbi:HK97 family phage prohead protease [bacterium]|nr:MAG: HK97 family phage prohead protease [bacterium]
MPVKYFSGGEIELKDSGENGIVGTITLYASAFDNVDSDGDKIIKGAFKRTIKERGPGGTNQILHLLHHDTDRIVGKPESLKEDDFGLLAVVPVPDTTLGTDTYKLYKHGIYNEHSIGYKTIDSEQEVTKGVTVNILKELKLWEISTVPWGANPLTRVVGIKSENKTEQLDEIALRLDKINKAITDNHFCEKTMNLLQIEIQLLSDAIKSIEAEPAEPVTMQEPFDPISFLKAYDLGLNIIKHFNFE